MKRQSLKDIFEYYYKHWNVISTIGEHPRTVRIREERERKLQRVGKILELAEDCESVAELLDDIALSKEIIEKAMSEEKFW